MTSAVGEPKRPLIDFPRPGTLASTTAAVPRTTAAAISGSLPRRGGRRGVPRPRSGRLRAVGGGGDVGPGGASGGPCCREKFIVGLPFVIGDDAEVGVQLQ